MKQAILVLLLALLAFAPSAYAGITITGDSNTVTATESANDSGTGSAAGSSGGSETKVESKRQAPGIGAPGLTSSAEACYGSVSGGVTSPFGGIVLGGTFKNEDCERRNYARVLHELSRGMPYENQLHEAALLLLAKNPEVRAAMEAAGLKFSDEPAKPAPGGYESSYQASPSNPVAPQAP